MARPYLQADDHADVFRAVAHRWRRAILDRLIDQPLVFGDLRKQLPISDATLSAHLRILRDAGLIKPERHGKSITYRPVPARLRVIETRLKSSKRHAAAAA